MRDAVSFVLYALALAVLGLLLAFLLAVLPAPVRGADANVSARAALALAAARPPQAVLTDCSCWVCTCTQRVTCGEKGCRHPRPKADPCGAACGGACGCDPARCGANGCSFCRKAKAEAPARSWVVRNCKRCDQDTCACGCNSSADCRCAPAAPPPVVTAPAVQPALPFVPAPVFAPPPVFFRPMMPMRPMPMMGGGACRGGG